MSEEQPQPLTARPVSFTGGGALHTPEPRSWQPFAVAGAVVVLIVAALVWFGYRQSSEGAASSIRSAYAPSLAISQVQMSDSSTLGGSKQTYLDGLIANHGNKTVTGVTVEVAFKSYTGGDSIRETMPINLIRSREPYVDTEPVSADALKPGDSRPFRVIFDTIPQDWDGAYPAVRVMGVSTR